MILQKYETAKDKETELILGERYQRFWDPDCKLKNNGFLATFDFRVFKDDILVAWLEVKKKNGFFEKSEIIPITKWRFAERSSVPCLFMIERDTEARLFDISGLIRQKLGIEREIKRREDQPGGSRKVVFIPADKSQLLYYVSF